MYSADLVGAAFAWRGVDFFFAAALGALVGVTELISRYRDTSTGAVFTRPGGIYILTNAVAAASALVIAIGFDWNFGVDVVNDGLNPPRNVELLRWVRATASGLGAMAIFRSALLTRRIGDVDVPIGPAAILSIILDAADRQVDRQRGNVIASAASRLMAGLDYEQARNGLATTALAALQNMPDDDQSSLADKLTALDGSGLAPFVKLQSLGEVLVQTFGEGLIEQLISSMKSDLVAATASGQSIPSPGGTPPIP